MFQIDHIHSVVEGTISDADISSSGEVCFILSLVNTAALFVNGNQWFSWNLAEIRHLRHCRWMSKDRVALWSLPIRAGFTDAVVTCSEYERVTLPVGLPKDIVFGSNIYFCCYGEDQYLRADPKNIASQMVAAFDYKGTMLFGLHDSLKNGHLLSSATEMELGCITESNDAIFSFNGAQGLWRLQPAQSRIESITLPTYLDGLLALSMTDGKVYLALDSGKGLSFCHLNLGSGAIEFDGSLLFSELKDSGHAKGKRYFKTRGCPDGGMVIFTGDSIWRVRF